MPEEEYITVPILRGFDVNSDVVGSVTIKKEFAYHFDKIVLSPALINHPETMSKELLNFGLVPVEHFLSYFEK